MKLIQFSFKIIHCKLLGTINNLVMVWLASAYVTELWGFVANAIKSIRSKVMISKVAQRRRMTCYEIQAYIKVIEMKFNNSRTPCRDIGTGQHASTLFSNFFILLLYSKNEKLSCLENHLFFPIHIIIFDQTFLSSTRWVFGQFSLSALCRKYLP